MKNLNVEGSNLGLNKMTEFLKSKTSKLALSTAILITLLGSVKEADAQKVVKKKEYKEILLKAERSQESIGESMAAFIFGGGLQRDVQLEIEKQNSLNATPKTDGKNSLFNNKQVKDADEKGRIKSKKEIEDWAFAIVDSLTTIDGATEYLAFHNYQESGVNVVGHKKGKGDLGSGWNLAAFPVSVNVDYLKDKKLPYGKEELIKLREEFEAIYEKHLSKWKTEALANRKSDKDGTYESADLLALEKARQELAKELYDKYVKPMIEKIFNQYYSTKEDKKLPKKK